MALHIRKNKIPADFSYVLRTSALEAALRESGIVIDTSLNHGKSTPYFTAYFWPPRPGIAYERLYLQAGSVPSVHARAAREHIESQVLPAFVVWLRGILALPENSPIRQTEQLFSRHFPAPY